MLLHMRKQKDPCNRTADQSLCFCYIHVDSTIPLCPKSQFSRIYPSSVAVQPGLCKTWSINPKDRFSHDALAGQMSDIMVYRKVPKFSDAIKLCCNLSKNQTKRPNLRVFRQKDANRIANSVDPDQTAHLRAV